MRSYPFLEHDGPIPFAHRGGAVHGAENSMAAFQRAVDLGYRYLETDVHATADGALLAFHDKSLDRVTDAAGQLGRLTHAEVERARIAGAEPIPRLDDLLDAFPNAKINIDVKARAAIGPLVQAIHRTNAIDRVCAASFSDRRVAAVRRALGPRLATSLGPRGVLALQLASRVDWLHRLVRQGIPCVQVPPTYRGVRVITPRFIETAHRLGLQVHAWTLDEPAEIERLLDLGVDGIMSDDLITLRRVLERRGAWTPPRDGCPTPSSPT